MLLEPDHFQETSPELIPEPGTSEINDEARFVSVLANACE